MHNPTMHQIFLEYIQVRDLSDRTIHHYQILIDNYLKDWLSIPIAAITSDMIQERHQHLSTRGKTVANQSFRLLGSMMNYAAVTYKLDVLFLTRAPQWNKEKPRFRRITPEQVGKWFDSVEALRSDARNEDEQYRQDTHADYFLFLILTGMRRSDAAKLVWDEVCWETGVITFQHTSLPKTGSQERCSVQTISLVFPLSDYLVDLLKRRKQESKSAWVFPHRYSTGPLSNPNDSIAKITERSGIKFGTEDLRRTFKDLCLECKVPVAVYDSLLSRPRSAEGVSNIPVDELRKWVQVVTDRFFQLTKADLPKPKQRIRLNLATVKGACVEQ